MNEKPRNTLEEAITQHHERIGRVVAAWNSLQDMFAVIFNDMLTNNDGSDTGYALWRVVDSDKTQRKLLRAFLKVKKDNLPDNSRERRILNCLIDAIGKADDVGIARNSIVHAYFRLERAGDRLLPMPLSGYGSHHSDSLVGKDLDIACENIKSDCGAIRSYCWILTMMLLDENDDGRTPWPRKLTLRSLDKS